MSTPVLSDAPGQPNSASSQQQLDVQDAATGRWWKLCLLAIGAGILVVSVIALNQGATLLQETSARVTHSISRGNLTVTVTEQGTLESSRNTEIKCNVRGGYGGRGGASTVTWVIPAGTRVQQGDELVRLDTKIIEETVSLGKTDTNIAKAAVARAEADLGKAEVAIDAYLEGTFRSQMSLLEKELEIAKRNLNTSQTLHRKTQTLFEQGFVTELELEVNGFTVTQAELELKVKETEIDVLSRLTKAMQLETLNGDLLATRARLEGREAGLELEQGRLALALEELGNCVIKAPQSGLVIYPSTANWKGAPDITEGASVRKDQVLLLMPDLSEMQVKVEIHESVIDRIKPGLTANVTLGDKTLETTVSSVAAVARPAGWWTGNVVKYDTVIPLPSGPVLNPGMSAQVEVVLARHDNVLLVPVAAVLETDQGQFCWVETDTKVERRSLELGDSNDEFIIVKAGLAEQDEVVLDPLASIDEARRLAGAAQVHTITRGDLAVTITEQGALESSNNTQVKCRVRGNSTINWVIENGSQVESGDELVRLENKQIEDYLHERTKFAHLSQDAAIGFRAQATTAGMAISEYLEGRYRTDLMRLEKDLAIAEAKLRTGKNKLEHARLMSKSGYSSELDVEQNEFAVTEARAQMEIKKTEIDVLKRFTKEEELITLRGNWEAAKSAAEGHEEVLAMDQARVKLAEQEIERCVIKAERSGLVIYPSTADWKDSPDIAEGATVHNDQVLLLMPDLSQMQVKFGIHESMIDRVQPGMRARVTLRNQYGADRTLSGEVSSVAAAAQPAGWWTGNIVKYDAFVKLPSVSGLKPGMSAEVQVTLGRETDVLMIPISAVVETDQGDFCWVGSPGQAERRSLELGNSNDAFFVVESGLEEGDQVLLNPSASLQQADSP